MYCLQLKTQLLRHLFSMTFYHIFSCFFCINFTQPALWTPKVRYSWYGPFLDLSNNTIKVRYSFLLKFFTLKGYLHFEKVKKKKINKNLYIKIKNYKMIVLKKWAHQTKALHIIFNNCLTPYQIRWRPFSFDTIIKVAPTQNNNN